MKTDCGVYVTIAPDGTLKRDLAAVRGKIPLEDTTVEDEIITFSELDFGPYAEVVDLVITSAAFIPHQGRLEDADMNVFQFIQDTTIDLVTTMEQDAPMFGTLTRAMIEDCIPEDDGTGLYVYTTTAQIISILTSVMYLQFEVNDILSDLRHGIPIDFEGRYDYLRMQELTQVLSRTAVGWSPAIISAPYRTTTIFCWCISSPANQTWCCASAAGGISSRRQNGRRSTVTGNSKTASPARRLPPR